MTRPEPGPVQLRSSGRIPTWLARLGWAGKAPATEPIGRKFIFGLADEAGDEAVARAVVELERRADLLDPPACSTTILSASVIASTWSCVT